MWSRLRLPLSVAALVSLGLLTFSPARQSDPPKEPPLGDGIRCVAWTRDGQSLAASFGEPKQRGWLAVFDVAARKQLWSHAEADGIPAIAFSPDGKTLALGAYDHKIKLLNAKTGVVVKSLEGHTNSVRGVAFSPDGKTLATGGWDQTVRLWDIATGAEIMSLAFPEERVYSVSFSPSGKWLLGVGFAALVWDATTGTEKRSLKRHVDSAVFLDDERLLTNDDDIRLWTLANNEEPQRVRVRTGNRLAYSAKARLVATTSGNSIRLFDFTTDVPTPEQKDRIRALVVLLDDDNYDVRQKASKDLLALGYVVEPELTRLMTDSKSAEVRIRARRIREELFRQSRAQLDGHTEQVEGLAFSADGRMLATGGRDGALRLWRMADFQEAARLIPKRPSP
jgi:WD40 repeat protein